jgi:hypothetical protein
VGRGVHRCCTARGADPGFRAVLPDSRARLHPPTGYQRCAECLDRSCWGPSGRRRAIGRLNYAAIGTFLHGPVLPLSPGERGVRASSEGGHIVRRHEEDSRALPELRP